MDSTPSNGRWRAEGGASTATTRESSSRAAIALLAGGAVALGLAPVAVDGSYNWMEHTTSESAAQGVHGAWVARLGFLLMAAGVFVTALRNPARWPVMARQLHLVFAVCLCAVAALSSRPWDEDIDFDTTEDLLHSIGATVMGFAFAFGVLAIVVLELQQGLRAAPLDLVATAAATILPLAMTAAPGVDGLLQRLMFATALVWYARQAQFPVQPSSTTASPHRADPTATGGQ